MARPRTPALPVFLNTKQAGDFLDRFWPHELFVGHGPLARFGALLKVPGLQTGGALVQAWKGTATAWPRLRTADTIQTIPARQLARFHKQGFTLYFTRVEDVLPGVIPFLRRIERDLGLRRGDMTCEAILARKGAGTQPHFDADCTFNIQLEGRKLWRVEPNASVEHPHKAGMIGQPVHPEMIGYAAPYPSSLSADARTFTTRPGSVTFLPHGCWHATECLDDSFALAFVSPGPKWYQLFANEVAAELVKVPSARRLSLVGPHARRDQAAAVLDQLRSIVDAMDVDALLKRWAGPPAFYFHRVPRGRRPTARRPPPELQPLVAWISSGPDVFSAFDAMDAFPQARSSAILRDLFTLVRAGAIELN